MQCSSKKGWDVDICIYIYTYKYANENAWLSPMLRLRHIFHVDLGEGMYTPLLCSSTDLQAKPQISILPPLKGLRSVNNLDTSQPFSTDCCQHCLITLAVCHPLPFSLELGPFLTYSDTIPIMLDALSFCSPVSIFYPIDLYRLVVCLYSSSFYSVYIICFPRPHAQWR